MGKSKKFIYQTIYLGVYINFIFLSNEVMAIYNTAFDAANTAVRAFLTKVGEFYFGAPFNTGTGKGKTTWQSIRDVYFEGKCAYCGVKSESLQIEHVLMFNRTEYGLHHPGNIVPCCKSCNNRSKNKDREYLNWEEHLKTICEFKQEIELFSVRKQRILDNFSRFNYPELNDKERHAIRVIANSLYDNIKAESEKSLTLYKKLDEAFVK
ncbi:HNH endonuclease [Pectobacterium polaris]|uniref:HNH endonuclease n=1 Tax=Pectobacterium polaris TaxID=2042057 RepID=UPI0020C5F220|nr:HNH endonuclease [Pectobacterium polaris]